MKNQLTVVPELPVHHPDPGDCKHLVLVDQDLQPTPHRAVLIGCYAPLVGTVASDGVRAVPHVLVRVVSAGRFVEIDLDLRELCGKEEW